MFEAAVRSKFTISLDENLLSLKDALRACGFKVMVFEQGKLDQELYHLMQGTAVLTQNSKDFLVDAVVYDFDVISAENIKFIDDDKTRNNKTVQKIAQAIRDSSFYNKRGVYLLTVFDDGKYNVKELV